MRSAFRNRSRRPLKVTPSPANGVCENSSFVSSRSDFLFVPRSCYIMYLRHEYIYIYIRLRRESDKIRIAIMYLHQPVFTSRKQYRVVVELRARRATSSSDSLSSRRGEQSERPYGPSNQIAKYSAAGGNGTPRGCSNICGIT